MVSDDFFVVVVAKIWSHYHTYSQSHISQLWGWIKKLMDQ